ncbi:MAG: LuxR C-terminal-related transcriptional regulator [Gammaproteobacteria bacterium]|nr:LuxR C-terminal-related transcriptional regulator [Gammaproteobacteria bacterium]
MENSRFSTLIYRIIGKPDRWHDDYIDIMHQVLDETESFDDPENFSELEVGDKILSRIRGTNEALTAFNTLLNESRFKMIILDHNALPIYHNQNASELYQEIIDPNAGSGSTKLRPGLSKLVTDAIETSSDAPSSLAALRKFGGIEDQIYLRSIHNRATQSNEESKFYLLLVLDQGKQTESLNAEFVSQYELTEKEQNVLLKLIHGRNVKQCAAELFVSENTVKTHLKSLFRKTDSKSQADVIRLALTHESQVLDSYFDPSSGGFGNLVTENTKDKFVTLKNGHEIAYREYGPEQGTPIFVCHNGYGCRLMVPEGYEDILQRLNKRLIIPDRSGTGKTPFRKDHPESWDEHFSAFIEAMNVGEYEVLGAVMGSVFALLHAVNAGDKLKRVHLASPVFVNSRKDMDYLIGIFAPSVRLVRASKRFAREIYELWLKSVTMNLSSHYRSMLSKSLGSTEKEILSKNHQTDTMLNLMVECFEEGASRCIQGISHDMVFCISPRKVDLSKVRVPVNIWWGTEDNRISKEGVQNLARQINNVTINQRQGYSEHIYYTLFEEILAQ